MSCFQNFNKKKTRPIEPSLLFNVHHDLLPSLFAHFLSTHTTHSPPPLPSKADVVCGIGKSLVYKVKKIWLNFMHTNVKLGSPFSHLNRNQIESNLSVPEI